MTPSAEGEPRESSPAGVAGAGAWLEISVEADHEAVEAVSEILGRVAPGGVSVEPAFDPTDEGLGARIDLTKPVVVRAHVPARDPTAAGDAVRRVREALGHLRAFDLRPIGEARTRLVAEADWAEAWKAHFPVLRVGRRIVIRPTWRRHRAGPGDVVVALDPGMAFGTGLHPTTRLCLEGLEALADRGELDGQRVLDVGCGSGILGISAVRLGAERVLGVDVDPIAVESTEANARRNRVARRVRAVRGTLPTGERPSDVVLANLVASILVELAPRVRDEVVPGGVVVASGIFADREGDVRDAFEGVGLRMSGRRTEGDWVMLEARARPNPRAAFVAR